MNVRAELLAEHHRRAQRRAVAIVLRRQVHQPIEREPVAAADRHLAVALRIPGEADARAEVVVVGREELIDEIDSRSGDLLEQRPALTEHDVAQRVVASP